MKIEPRNKWRKADSVKLNTSLNTSMYRDLMKDSWHKLNTSRSNKLYDSRILKSEY